MVEVGHHLLHIGAGELLHPNITDAGGDALDGPAGRFGGGWAVVELRGLPPFQQTSNG